MMGQKMQFALAHYYSVYHIVNSGWNKEKAKDKIRFHLSRPMGGVVHSKENDAPLGEELYEQVVQFKA
jgi:hypothetical protein